MSNFSYQFVIVLFILVWQMMLEGTWTELMNRNKRQVETEQLIGIPKKSAEENLMLGLIKGFAHLQNVTQITACLPIPRAVGESIPWGILTMNLTTLEHKNRTTHCKQVPVTQWSEQVKVIRKQWKWMGREEDCRKLLNHQFTPASPIGDMFAVGSPRGWCSYDVQVKTNGSRSIMEWKCNETNQTIPESAVSWDSIWSMAIMSQFQYMAKTSWCIVWDGSVFTVWPSVNDRKSTLGIKEKIVPWWKCEKIYDCSTTDRAIERIPSLAAALKYGCLCRGLKNDLKLTETFIPKRGTFFSCRKTTIQSPGHLVWALSDGTWTTQLSLDGTVKQIILGMPTLCPIWKKSPFKGPLENLRLKRTKRSETDDEIWNEPSTGIKIGWALESLLNPIASYRNREWLYHLTGQVEKLANITKKGFKELNIQLQATSRMTLQNRMALDLLLLKEHGVCGYLKDRLDHCCIHIPNVTQDIEHDLELLSKVEEETETIREDMSEDWLGKIFSGLGWNLSSWLKSIIKTLFLLLIVFLMIMLTYVCLKRQFTNRIAVNRMIMREVPTIPPEYSPPPQYVETNIDLQNSSREILCS